MPPNPGEPKRGMLPKLPVPGKPLNAGMLLPPGMLPNPGMLLPLPPRRSKGGKVCGCTTASSLPGSIAFRFRASAATARTSRAATNTLADLSIVAAAALTSLDYEQGYVCLVACLRLCCQSVRWEREGSEEEEESGEGLYSRGGRKGILKTAQLAHRPARDEGSTYARLLGGGRVKEARKDGGYQYCSCQPVIANKFALTTAHHRPMHIHGHGTWAGEIEEREREEISDLVVKMRDLCMRVPFIPCFN
jgi:hypothetical protein